ncbi:EAL domain-containing protein [Pseudomonas zhanjiangensis]|uniref:cyclic-guanylate-specific phosphodiesterase n=1 Tax=Pseudomonas zhanjiangensis TaxID=3239015 RepID=A0ABV3YZR4_9PSED
MNKATAVTLTVVLGLVAISVPIAIAIHLAWKQAFNQEMELASSIAQDILRRNHASLDQVRAVFHELAAAQASDPCSDENRRLMAKLDLGSEHVQAIGYIKDNVLRCSSFGRHKTVVSAPAYETSYGAEIRLALEFPLLPGKKFLVVTDKATGYTAAVHPNLPIDVFAEDPDISVGLFSVPSGRLILGRGNFQQQWMGHLGDAEQAQFSDTQSLVAIQRSSRYAFAAFASVPTAKVYQGLVQAALVLVPIGVAAGVALGFAVRYLAMQQLALPAMLKVALRRHEFFLNYQPIVDLQTGKWVGAEALIRWRRPNGELVRPDLFIAVAEEAGLIQRVTQRVMTILGSEAGELFERYPDFHIAVNLSAADLESQATIEGLRCLARETAARHGNLLIEATERGLMRAEVVKEILGEIRSMGVQTAIDDFGTGYSSLSYLESFEFDYLKIDKSFVDTLGKDAATSQVVPHIIEMAKSLKLEMIAEGVETEAQAQFLRERGVQFAQGWLFAKPMSFEQLIAGLSASGASQECALQNGGMRGDAPEVARA